MNVLSDVDFALKDVTALKKSDMWFISSVVKYGTLDHLAPPGTQSSEALELQF